MPTATQSGSYGVGLEQFSTAHRHSVYWIKPSALVQRVTLWTIIHKFLASNLSRNTDYSQSCRGFPWLLRAYSGTVTCVGSKYFSSTFFTTHYTLMSLTFDAL